MAKQICKDCAGRGWIAGPLYAMEGSYKCPTCDGAGTIHRTGPYRLMNGEWSDGVDRSEPIDTRPCSNRYEVTTGKKYSHVWHESLPAAEFDTWAEAIRYADYHARTTKNGGAS